MQMMGNYVYPLFIPVDAWLLQEIALRKFWMSDNFFQLNNGKYDLFYLLILFLFPSSPLLLYWPIVM